jgi:hypothetical protein
MLRNASNTNVTRIYPRSVINRFYLLSTATGLEKQFPKLGACEPLRLSSSAFWLPRLRRGGSRDRLRQDAEGGRGEPRPYKTAVARTTEGRKRGGR